MLFRVLIKKDSAFWKGGIPVKNARELCVQALVRVERTKAYSNLTLDQLLEQEGKNRTKDPLWRAESAFASTLFYGVLERKLTLDSCIEKYAVKGFAGMAGEVLAILRISFYQLLFMPNIPESAVVNEAVKLTRTFRRPGASGFVNGVLRSFLRDGKALPEYEDPVTQRSVLYSLPRWILLEWQQQFGEEETDRIATAFTRQMPLYARVNLLRNTPAELCKRLRCQLEQQKGFVWREEMAVIDPSLPGCLRLSGLGSLRKIPAFVEGRFHIQDKSSQLCALSLDAQPGDRVLDLCAAPGGKTFTIAQQMQGKGQVDAFDLHEHRVKLIREGAARLGLQNVTAQARDALKPCSAPQQYDRVLCDVPCSGLGILGRKPEIRYKSPEEFEQLPEIQYQILENAAAYLRDGGILVYSTCTLRREENQQVTGQFLRAHPEFAVEEFPQCCGDYQGLPGEQLLLPHQHDSDGFYICRMRKKIR